jgi:hypothetical protein
VGRPGVGFEPMQAEPTVLHTLLRNAVTSADAIGKPNSARAPHGGGPAPDAQPGPGPRQLRRLAVGNRLSEPASPGLLLDTQARPGHSPAYWLTRPTTFPGSRRVRVKVTATGLDSKAGQTMRPPAFAVAELSNCLALLAESTYSDRAVFLVRRRLPLPVRRGRWSGRGGCGRPS